MVITDLPDSASSVTGSQFTCFVVTKVKVVYFLCCYKSEASGAGDSVPEEAGGLSNTSSPFYLIYWYKSKNTDAAAGGSSWGTR